MPASLALTLPLALVLLVLGAGAAVMARRGWAETLLRTGRIGVHTPASSMSDRAFLVANKVAAPVFGGAAVVGLVAGVLLLALTLPIGAALLVFLAGLTGTLVLLAAGGLLGDRAARAVPVPARAPVAKGAGCGGCGCGSGGCAGLTRKDAVSDSAVG